MIGTFYCTAKADYVSSGVFSGAQQMGTLYNMDMLMFAQNAHFYVTNGTVWLSTTTLPDHIPVTLTDMAKILNSIENVNPEFAYLLNWNQSLKDYSVLLHSLGDFPSSAFIDKIVAPLNYSIQSYCTPPTQSCTFGQRTFASFRAVSSSLLFYYGYGFIKIFGAKGIGYLTVKYQLGPKAAMVAVFFLEECGEDPNVWYATLSPILSKVAASGTFSEVAEMCGKGTDQLIVAAIGGMATGDLENLVTNKCS